MSAHGRRVADDSTLRFGDVGEDQSRRLDGLDSLTPPPLPAPIHLPPIDGPSIILVEDANAPIAVPYHGAGGWVVALKLLLRRLLRWR